MSYNILKFETSGEKFYNITDLIRKNLKDTIELAKKDKGDESKKIKSGILHLFLPHTSCAMTISEAFEKDATIDVENFLKSIAPRNLPFITHTTEGKDDSPSHMKSVLLQQSISVIIDNDDVVLGRWQGIYLAEFRDGNKNREIYLKFIY